MLTRVLVYLQYLLPKYGLTALVHWISRVRIPAVKNFLITQFVRFYKVTDGNLTTRIPFPTPFFDRCFLIQC